MSGSGGSGGAAGRRKTKTKEEQRRTGSSSSTASSQRGERERIKWRKQQRAKELKKTEEHLKKQKRLDDIEKMKRKAEQQKKEIRKRHEEYEKVLLDAEAVQKAVENVMSDYRESKNAIKVQLYTDSSDFIQTQQIEKSHLNAAGDRIRSSEIQLAKLESELTKTKQIRDEYIRDLDQNWLLRLWKYLY